MQQATSAPSVKRGYRYRIYPTADQVAYLATNFGCARYVYNTLLAAANASYHDYTASAEAYRAEQTALLLASGIDELEVPKVILAYQAPRPSTHTHYFANQIAQLRRCSDTPWLAEASAVALVQSARNLGAAYSGYFQRIKAAKSAQAKKLAMQSGPKFHRKHGKQSIRLPSGEFSLIGSDANLALKLPKSPGAIHVIWSRPLPSSPSQVTITKTPSGQYYATFLCTRPLKPTNGQGIIGIDLGLKTLAAISGTEDTIVVNVKHLKASAARLAILQRKLSRCQLGSNRYTRQRSRVAKLHQHISNQRNYYLHLWTTKLISENKAICLESLSVQDMIMADVPNLAIQVADASWSRIRQMLQYKAEDTGYVAIIIAPDYWPSTQLCNLCNTKASPGIKLGVSSWTCRKCNTVHDRDINAARNLRNLAYQAQPLWSLHPGSTTKLQLTSGSYLAAG